MRTRILLALPALALAAVAGAQQPAAKKPTPPQTPARTAARADSTHPRRAATGRKARASMKVHKDSAAAPAKKG